MKKPKVVTSDRKEGSAKQVLILHGWGASSKSFQQLKELLEKQGFIVTVPDLPGFGSAPLIKNPMTFEDYVEFVEDVIGSRKVVLIGHSFGGRLAIRFAVLHDNLVAKLILTGASGIIHPLSPKRKIIHFFAMARKWIKVPRFRWMAYKLLGEWDYYLAGPLKETFKQVYRVSIEEDLPKISVPTLLIWGENDVTTSLMDGELMKKEIKNSKLIVVKGASHKLPYQMPHVFVEKILPFLYE